MREACSPSASNAVTASRIWSPNCAEWMIAQYAAATAGAILVNINPAYQLRELEHALRLSGTSVLITARRFRSSDYAAMLATLLPAIVTTPRRSPLSDELPSLRTIVYLGSDPNPGGLSWEELAALGDAVPESRLRERESSLQFDDPVNIQVHLGHHRVAERRDALASQHSEQRLLRGRAPSGTRPMTAFASPCPSIIASGA